MNGPSPITTMMCGAGSAVIIGQHRQQLGPEDQA